MKKLKTLYNNVSKHSNYQVLPKSLINLSLDLSQNINRFEEERFNFAKEYLDFNNSKILDIGANTGYFSITSMENGALSCECIEGNSDHIEFITEASRHLNFNISSCNEYYNKQTKLTDFYDITFFLNVAHHIGDDFDQSVDNIEFVKKEIAELFNPLIGHTNYIIFQIGYCWKGDESHLLFKDGTKLEQIEFVTRIIGSDWIIDKIGILEDDLTYRSVNDKNLSKNLKLKEFGNRPLFILSSAKV